MLFRTCWTRQQMQQIDWTLNSSRESLKLSLTGSPFTDSTSPSATWRGCRWRRILCKFKKQKVNQWHTDVISGWFPEAFRVGLSGLHWWLQGPGQQVRIQRIGLEMRYYHQVLCIWGLHVRADGDADTGNQWRPNQPQRLNGWRPWAGVTKRQQDKKTNQP